MTRQRKSERKIGGKSPFEERAMWWTRGVGCCCWISRRGKRKSLAGQGEGQRQRQRWRSNRGVTDACDGPEAALARPTSRFFLPSNLHIYCTPSQPPCRPPACNAQSPYILRPPTPLYLSQSLKRQPDHSQKSASVTKATSILASS